VFPLELPARVILSVLNARAGVVLDPFCGTGTTLVAAKLLGKDFIGIDISPEYVAYAQARLAQAEKDQARLLREVVQHQIEITFADRKARGDWG
jgi:modification methylase